MTNSRQSGCRRSFVATLFLAVILFVFYQFRLNEIAKTDSISQLELRVDSLVRQLRRLEDVISIQGFSRNPLAEIISPASGDVDDGAGPENDPPSSAAGRQERLVRDFIWLKFLRRCEELKKPLKLLLLEESLVRNVDATNRRSASSSSLSSYPVPTQTLLNNFTHFAVFASDVAAFVDVVLQTAADSTFASSTLTSSASLSSSSSSSIVGESGADSSASPSAGGRSSASPFVVDLIVANPAKDSVEKIPLASPESEALLKVLRQRQKTNYNDEDINDVGKMSRTVLGFSFFSRDLQHQNFRHLRRVNVSIIFEKRNSIIDVKYPGYYFLPWSWTGFPRALPPFATRRIAVESFEGDLFQYPANVSHYLWHVAASDFVPCDAARNAAFAKKSLKPTHLDPVKDKGRIRAEMSLVDALQRSMANWERRNWIFAGTLLGWYRQCSLIPHDQDMDTASWIHDFQDWMIEYYRKHPVLKMYVKFGLKDDSLEFKMGDKRKRTIDLFWMYPGPAKNQSWLGIQTFDGKFTKKISFYPTITKICSADLHGYLVYVPCDTWSIIKIEYGVKNWFEPNPKYDYKNDAFNWRINGSWTAKQWRGGAVYKVFQ